MTQHQDNTGNKVDNLLATDRAEHAFEQGLGAGERNVDSASEGYQVTRDECNITVCDGTGVVSIGGGAAGDTHLMGILILHNATAATATLVGFTKKDTGGTEAAAATLILTGNATGTTPVDVYIDFKGSINDNAALAVQGSVDEKVIVFWKPV